MIYIRTVAYNAAQTLRRTVESVLNQTYGEFKYYLCDNGSTDNGETRKIVEEYAKLDNRIIPSYNEKNHAWTNNMETRALPRNIESDDFFCSLDADDEYLLNYFEEMLAFINEYDLDIAACGSDFLSVEENNKLVGRRLHPSNLLLQGKDFSDYYPVYHQFIRTIWGKLFKGKTLKNIELDSTAPGYPRAYGGDTFFTTRAFRDAQRVGILAKSLHKYYVSPKSISYVMHPERVKSDQILHELALEYLKPYGSISPHNEKFLYLVYLDALIATLAVLFNSQLPPSEKTKNIEEMFSYEPTVELFRRGFVSESDLEKQIRGPIIKWLMSQNECRKPEGAKVATKILVGMYQGLRQTANDETLEYLFLEMPEMIEYLLKNDYKRILERIKTWFKKRDRDNPPLTMLEISANRALKKPSDELFTLFMDVRKQRPQSSEKLGINALIRELLSKYPLTKNISVDLASALPQTICFIFQGNISSALDAFISSSQSTEIADNDAENHILFGQNLSAAAENTDAYIYFKKIWISYLLDCTRGDEARLELDEFEQLLPGDEDLAGLRKRLAG